ncbi:MAG: lipoyl(octanoyl) transferase LipB [Bacteroidia bacterium]|nr:lipoyl(octanoyl) transferase LipB [Bacteroidia bacterium]
MNCAHELANNVVFQDLGLTNYKTAWEYQEAVFKKILNYKTGKSSVAAACHLLFCEHPHVYTLGKSGTKNNLLINEQFLKKINATYYKTNRGGDITYHGPGQIVGYPVIDIEKLKFSLKEYIFRLEEAIISALKEYGIFADRLAGATGVWLDTTEKSKTRKICAIGVRASRYVAMHGFALNVNTDLSYFNYINPCGFTDKGVTSISKELGKQIDLNETKEILKQKIAKTLGIQLMG